MSLNSFEDLIIMKLKDLYSAEQQFAQAQPQMVEATSDEELRTALEGHIAVTKEQIERLEQIADILGVTLEGEVCDAAAGLIKEGQKIMQEEGDPFVKDAALLAAAQAIEHYEIAGYGTASAYARRLKQQDINTLLQQTLAEERGADTLLTEVAETSINKQAVSYAIHAVEAHF